MAAIQFARENQKPLLGICLGLQLASIEFAKNVLGLSEATSAELNPGSGEQVIHLMKEQEKVQQKGGTMRLGAYPCRVKKGSKAHGLYKTEEAQERHRHRLEFNNQYRKQFEDKGVVFSGTSPDNELVEILEINSHPWFIACQFHPEKSGKTGEKLLRRWLSKIQ